MDAVEWRTWFNVHMNHFRHGLMLEDLPGQGRDLALGILRATLSERGFYHARSIMRLNELLAQLTGDHEAFGEWPYFLSIFGTPGRRRAVGLADRRPPPLRQRRRARRPDRHDPDLHGRRAPTGAPRTLRRDLAVRPGGGAGARPDPLLRRRAATRAILHPSLHPDEIPVHLQNLADGRIAGGAFHDNLVAPYQGVAGADMTDAQRRVLLALAATYVGWTHDGHTTVRMSEVDAHLDETWYSWYGGTGDESPFYYRVHSPVILIEFDHHPGVAFDNEVPSRHHVHTVVRTPNGGDYGSDLLRQHHDQFDHRHGDHATRH